MHRAPTQLMSYGCLPQNLHAKLLVHKGNAISDTSNLFFLIYHVGPFLIYTLRELVNLFRPHIHYHFNAFPPYS